MRLLSFPVIDILMDLTLLGAVQLTFGSLHPGRLLAAALVLSIGSLMLLMDFPRIPSLILHAVVLLLANAIATNERRPLRILRASVCMLCLSAGAAGFAALNAANPLPCALLGMILITCLLRRHRHIRFKWNIELYVEKGGQIASFPALIDTGNRLREHRSKLPVLIVEAGLIRNITAQLTPDEFQSLPFGVLGGSGEIRCFQADRICVLLPGRGPCEAPACWVAIFEGRIPGQTRALAPPEFTQVYDSKQHSLSHFIQNTTRRFRYGFFKRKAIHLRTDRTDTQGFGMLYRRE